ncbi:MAG: hypothetical protein AB1589_24110, partial [Cyanobacteriota bacterium]
VFLSVYRVLALFGSNLKIGVSESGIRNQESGVRSQESGVRSQESGVRRSDLHYFVVSDSSWCLTR